MLRRVAPLSCVVSLAACASLAQSTRTAPTVERAAPGASASIVPSAMVESERAPAELAPNEDDQPLDRVEGCVAAGRFDIASLALDPACAVSPSAPEIQAWIAARGPSPFKVTVLDEEGGIHTTPGAAFTVRVRVENPGDAIAEVLVPPGDEGIQLWHRNTDGSGGSDEFSRDATAMQRSWARVRWEARAIGYVSVVLHATFLGSVCTQTMEVGGQAMHARVLMDLPLSPGSYSLAVAADFRTGHHTQIEGPGTVGPMLLVDNPVITPTPTLTR